MSDENPEIPRRRTRATSTADDNPHILPTSFERYIRLGVTYANMAGRGQGEQSSSSSAGPNPPNPQGGDGEQQQDDQQEGGQGPLRDPIEIEEERARQELQTQYEQSVIDLRRRFGGAPHQGTPPPQQTTSRDGENPQGGETSGGSSGSSHGGQHDQGATTVDDLARLS